MCMRAAAVVWRADHAIKLSDPLLLAIRDTSAKPRSPGCHLLGKMLMSARLRLFALQPSTHRTRIAAGAIQIAKFDDPEAARRRRLKTLENGTLKSQLKFAESRLAAGRRRAPLLPFSAFACGVCSMSSPGVVPTWP